jgi:hypothetical protein
MFFLHRVMSSVCVTLAALTATWLLFHAENNDRCRALLPAACVDHCGDELMGLIAVQDLKSGGQIPSSRVDALNRLTQYFEVKPARSLQLDDEARIIAMVDASGHKWFYRGSCLKDSQSHCILTHGAKIAVLPEDDSSFVFAILAARGHVRGDHWMFSPDHVLAFNPAHPALSCGDAETNTASVRVRNCDDSPVTVGSISGSCGCASIHPTGDLEIQPQSDATVEITLRPGLADIRVIQVLTIYSRSPFRQDNSKPSVFRLVCYPPTQIATIPVTKLSVSSSGNH